MNTRPPVRILLGGSRNINVINSGLSYFIIDTRKLVAAEKAILVMRIKFYWNLLMHGTVVVSVRSSLHILTTSITAIQNRTLPWPTIVLILMTVLRKRKSINTPRKSLGDGEGQLLRFIFLNVKVVWRR